MVDEILDERLEFLEARERGIGATDSPKILGLSRRGSALTVYRDKPGPGNVPPPAGTMGLPAWMGLKLQSVVAEMYTARTGQRLRADNRQHTHPDHPWMRCHLDYRGLGRPRLLVECKTRSYMREWGPDGSIEVPPDVWVQCQHEMAVTGAIQCDVAVLFGLGFDFRVYPLARSDEFINAMIPRLESFWVNNVLAGVPPVPSGFAGDSDVIRDRHPDDDGTLRSATPEQEMLVNRLKVARRAKTDAELAQADLENKLKAIIGDASGLTGAFGTITWKKSKDGESIDWEQVAVNRENVIEELLLLANPGDDPELVARLARAQSVAETAVGLATTVKPGTRRFLVNFTGES